MAKADADAKAGQSPAQRAGAASTPGDVAEPADSVVAPNASNVATATLAAEQGLAATDPSVIAATIPRGSGSIQYLLDGEPVTRQAYVDHLAAQEREAAKAELAAAEEAMGGMPTNTGGK